MLIRWTFFIDFIIFANNLAWSLPLFELNVKSLLQFTESIDSNSKKEDQSSPTNISCLEKSDAFDIMDNYDRFLLLIWMNDLLFSYDEIFTLARSGCLLWSDLWQHPFKFKVNWRYKGLLILKLFLGFFYWWG